MAALGAERIRFLGDRSPVAKPDRPRIGSGGGGARWLWASGVAGYKEDSIGKPIQKISKSMIWVFYGGTTTTKLGFSSSLRKDRPWNFFRRNRLNINQWRRRNFDDVVLANGIGLSTWHQFSNYWDISGAINHNFRTQDDLDTRGGPLIVRPAITDFNFRITSDDRRAISSGLYSSWGNDAEGSTWRTMALGVEIKPAYYIECYFQPRYQWGFDDAQWVGNIDADGDGIVEHFVYGTLNSKTLDLTTRLNVIFSRDLSLELYLQPFLAVGAYKHFKELARPDSYMFTPYTELDYNPDFRQPFTAE